MNAIYLLKSMIEVDIHRVSYFVFEIKLGKRLPLFQMRKCGTSPMWSVLVYIDNKWQNVCFVKTSTPSFAWINKVRVYSTIVTDVHTIRRMLLH